MTDTGQLTVTFERDLKPRHYPYLGQVCLLGAADQLLEGYHCKRPVEFSPRYGSPAAQLTMGGVLQGSGDVAERFRNLEAWTPAPFWVQPAEGWRTARCLQAALPGGALSAGVVDIIGPLSAEIDDWVDLMDAAVDADIRFQIDMEECPHSPEDLVTFVEREAADTADMIREALEAAGIEITCKEE